MHLRTVAVRQDDNYDEDGGAALGILFSRWDVVLVNWDFFLGKWDTRNWRARPGATPS